MSELIIFFCLINLHDRELYGNVGLAIELSEYRQHFAGEIVLMHPLQSIQFV